MSTEFIHVVHYSFCLISNKSKLKSLKYKPKFRLILILLKMFRLGCQTPFTGLITFPRGSRRDW